MSLDNLQFAAECILYRGRVLTMRGGCFGRRKRGSREVAAPEYRLSCGGRGTTARGSGCALICVDRRRRHRYSPVTNPPKVVATELPTSVPCVGPHGPALFFGLNFGRELVDLHPVRERVARAKQGADAITRVALDGLRVLAADLGAHDYVTVRAAD